MTPLGNLISARIAAHGPMSIADYMSECLLHPQFGYYARRDPFGVDGDFITAPEISQMFGELLGLCLAQTWIDQDSPADFALAELGPGRGTLMADILRATSGIPGFHAAASLYLLEASETLRDVQQKSLAGYSVTWLNNLDELPARPLFLVANEFFDALPIRQFTRDKAGWRETHVGLAGSELVFGLSSPAPINELEHRLADSKPGDIVEICPNAKPIMETIADRIKNHSGAAFIIDYGGWRSLGDTFQAVRNHKPVKPLSEPGDADLTAHVDFEGLAKSACGVSVSKLIEQGQFLMSLGINERAQALATKLEGKALQSHLGALHRLTNASEMGTLFKALSIYPTNMSPPAGFFDAN